MASPASVRGHPIHPMLVTLPIGLWVFSLVADLIFLASGNPTWYTTALHAMGGGIVGAAGAAIPGAMDLFNYRDAHVRRIGIKHGALNVLVLLLFALNLWWRLSAGPEAMPASVWLSAVAVALLAVSGWLGGHMVYVHRAGVRGGVEG